MFKCNYCDKKLSSKSSLKVHQTRAKYCLKIQGKEQTNGEFVCPTCGKDFNVKFHLQNHIKVCEKNHPIINKYREDNLLLKTEIEMLKNTIRELREQLEKTQQRYDKLSLTAVKRPTVSNKTMYVNNLIKNMQPLTLKDIESSVPMLTLEHHAQGAEGYAQFALEFPFKDKIVCVDVSRNKIKYKNDEGDIIEDVGFRKMMIKLCKSLRDRSFSLSIQHIDKLSADWSEKEREAYDFMEAAVAISTYAQGRENEFCNKIIKLISKGSNSKN